MTELRRPILGHQGGHRARVFCNGIQSGASTVKEKEKHHPPSFSGGAGPPGGPPDPNGGDGSSSNSSSATSQVSRSMKSGRSALTRKKEATEVKFDMLCEPRHWRRYKRKCKKLFANASGYPWRVLSMAWKMREAGHKIYLFIRFRTFPEN